MLKVIRFPLHFNVATMIQNKIETKTAFKIHFGQGDTTLL